MKVSTTSDRLKHILSERRLKQIDVIDLAKPYAKKLNMKLTKSDISQYVSGKVEPGQDKLTLLGMALNVSEAWLMGYDVPQSREITSAPIPPGFLPMPETEKVPRVGRIACGQPILADQNIEEYDDVPKIWRATFTLVCKGDSMEPKIKDGDIVAIRSTQGVDNGEIAAVRIGDEATLKRVFVFEDHIELRAENPMFATIIKIGEAMRDVHIEGKAVGLCRNL